MAATAVTGAAAATSVAPPSPLLSSYSPMTAPSCGDAPPALRAHAAQAAAVQVLDAVAAALPYYLPWQHAAATVAAALGIGGSARGRRGERKGMGLVPPFVVARRPPGGVGGRAAERAAVTAYVSRRASVCGTVGVGKAFLMDLVVAGVPSPAVQRVQTACCMLDYHARAHFLRGAGGGRS